MYITMTGSKTNRDVYINQSYRGTNGKSTSRIYKKLGKEKELLERFGGDQEKMIAWAKEEARKETELFNQHNSTVSLEFSKSAWIPKGEERCFHVGYLFLQDICCQLRLDNICRKIKGNHRFSFDLNAIMTDLVYARILSPSSKLSSYAYCQSLLEPPKYAIQDVYRALSVIAKESDLIQCELYKNSNFVHARNNKILYYDCTNYYFEIEEDDDFRKYGKSKEHRPNPIVTMGMFMDADGIPLAFDVFPGNQNEQTTLKPLESKVISDFGCSKFIFCSDAGLGSKSNRFFNGCGERSYIITQSLKKMRAEDRAVALDPSQFRRVGSRRFVNLKELDETDEAVFNAVYYKLVPVTNGQMNEEVIVTYSPRYKTYQKHVRAKQVERAIKIINEPGRKRKGKNQNDPARFIKKTALTADGEIADKSVYELNESLILDEEKYDGFYAVITNLEDDVEEIVRINKQRWEIEENFRIMKTEFDARPVYVRREDRIKAHFMTCFISLLVYRLLEKRLGEKYTCQQILDTLRGMNLTRISKEGYYIPSYKRTDLTDDLHTSFGFRTDTEIITRSTLRSIIKKTKIKRN